MAWSASPPSCRMWTRSTTSCGRAIRIPGRAVTYGDVRLAEELQFSVYNFEYADVPRLWEHFNSYEAEARALLEQAGSVLASDAGPNEKKTIPAAGHV